MHRYGGSPGKPRSPRGSIEQRVRRLETGGWRYREHSQPRGYTEPTGTDVGVRVRGAENEREHQALRDDLSVCHSSSRRRPHPRVSALLSLLIRVRGLDRSSLLSVSVCLCGRPSCKTRSAS